MDNTTKYILMFVLIAGVAVGAYFAYQIGANDNDTVRINLQRQEIQMGGE